MVQVLLSKHSMVTVYLMHHVLLFHERCRPGWVEDRWAGGRGPGHLWLFDLHQFLGTDFVLGLRFLDRYRVLGPLRFTGLGLIATAGVIPAILPAVVGYVL